MGTTTMCDFNAYIGSCGEYLQIVKNPIAFYGGGCGPMCKCDQGDWVKHFSAWSAFQFDAAVLVGIGWIIGWAAWGYFGSGIAAFIQIVIQAWFNAHLFWFLVTKANCCNMPILYLVSSILTGLNGISGIINSLGYIGVHIAFIIAAIASFVQGFATIEMAVGLFKLWQGAGKTAAAAPPTPAEPAAQPAAEATPVEATEKAEAKTAEVA